MRKQIALPILAIFIGLAIAPPNFALAQGQQNKMESHDKMTTEDMASDKMTKKKVAPEMTAVDKMSDKDKMDDNSKMSNQK